MHAISDVTRFVLSNALGLGISRRGALVATVSMSRAPHEIDLDVLPVLLAFATPRTADEARRHVAAAWEIDPVEFDSLVTALADIGILVVAAAPRSDTALGDIGFAAPAAHHAMLRDRVRLDAYRRAIARHVSGRRVLEIGCGTGVLSILAAKAGASAVDAIEEASIALVAQELIAANDCGDRVNLYFGNSQDVELGEKADILIHELLGTDPFAENVLPTLADARARLLQPGARMLPARLDVCCIGVDIEAGLAAERRRLEEEVAAYAADYGVDFGPFAALLGRASRARPNNSAGPHAIPVTDEAILASIDFERLNTHDMDRTVQLTAIGAGTLSSLCVFFRAHFDDDICLSTDPRATPTHWGQDYRPLDTPLELRAGTVVPVRAWLKTHYGLQRLQIGLA